MQVPIRETSNRFSALRIEHTEKNPLSMDMSVNLGEQEKVGEWEWGGGKDLLELHGAGPLISINLLSIPHLPVTSTPYITSWYSGEGK